MSTAILTEPRVVSVDVTEQAIAAHLSDGRVVSVPLEWSWRLKDATPEQRAQWEIIGDGQGVHWPDVDEDISVEGMLRGVPAKRPSRTEMRILLDASSLIDAGYGKPLAFDELDKLLREHHARLILTFTNVMEFAAPPFEKTGDKMVLRDQLQQIERLPVGYLREGGILLAELREAVNAFAENRECAPINPYVKRWDETLFPEGPPPTEILVDESLYELASMALSKGDPVSRAKRGWEEPLRNQFEADRKLPAEIRKAIEGYFHEALLRHLDSYRIGILPDRIKELAKWIYNNPVDRCPGFRLAYDWRQEQMNNLVERVSGNDIFDRVHVLAVPYVDAITMDRNTAGHCRNAVKRLKKMNPAINYEERIFTSVQELLDAKF